MSKASTFKSSVNVKSVGPAPMKLIAAMDGKVGEEILYCSVLGKATGIVPRQDPKDPDKKYFGLKGNFEVISGQPGQEAVGGAILFAPDAIHNLVADQLERGATTVSFVFEAYLVVGGTAGFTWKYKFADDGAPEEDDVLSDLRAILPSNKLLPAPPVDELEEAGIKSKKAKHAA